MALDVVVALLAVLVFGLAVLCAVLVSAWWDLVRRLESAARGRRALLRRTDQVFALVAEWESGGAGCRLEPLDPGRGYGPGWLPSDVAPVDLSMFEQEVPVSQDTHETQPWEPGQEPSATLTIPVPRSPGEYELPGEWS